MIPSQVSGNGATTSNGVIVYNQSAAQQTQKRTKIELKKLEFFDLMGTLLEPTVLYPTTQKIQEITYTFFLTSDQANEISLNRDIQNMYKPEYLVQVQLRFCAIESLPSCEQQDDSFPPNVTVKVNSKPCPLPNLIPTNKPNAEAKRQPRPVNITPYVKISPMAINEIKVTWSSDNHRYYAVAVYLVEKLSAATLLDRMRDAQKIHSSDATRAMIQGNLNEDADCEIATTTVNVTLVCPLGKIRMKTPCRASTCTHIQCFDAETYLQMNERKPTWCCPVCYKPAPYENLVIDAYFEEVLSSSDTNEIQLHKDGSWSSQVVVDSDAQILDDVTIIAETGQIGKAAPMTILNKPAVSIATITSTASAVDLTLSDSDDEVTFRRNLTSLRQQLVSNPATVPVPAASSRTNGGTKVTSKKRTR